MYMWMLTAVPRRCRGGWCHVGGYGAAVGDLSSPATHDATVLTASAAATLADSPSPGVARVPPKQSVSGGTVRRKSGGDSDDGATTGVSWTPRPERLTAAVHKRAEMGEQSVNVVSLRTAASPFPALHRLCSLAVRGASGKRWFGGGELKRLTAVAHRRAEFLRPSPSVPVRGLRCGGACGESEGEGVDWGESEDRGGVKESEGGGWAGGRERVE